jgi:hypothetical protein
MISFIERLREKAPWLEGVSSIKCASGGFDVFDFGYSGAVQYEKLPHCLRG